MHKLKVRQLMYEVAALGVLAGEYLKQNELNSDAVYNPKPSDQPPSLNKLRQPVCADNNWHCTFPECGCNR